MKKIVILFASILILTLALSIAAGAEGGIGWRGYEPLFTSESGYTRTAYKPVSVSTGGGELKNAGLPKKYDARDTGVITSVKNQDPYGACWAFSAMSCAESSLISMYPDKFTVDDLDLSEVQHAYFSYSDAPDKLNMTGDSSSVRKMNFLDVGGNAYYSTATLSKWFGVAEESSVVSYEKATASTKIKDKKAYSDNIATLKNAYWLDMSDHSTVKAMIKKYGSVSVSCFYDYAYLNTENNAMYCPINMLSNHQITLVGWDDNYSKKNFGISQSSIFGEINLNQPKKSGAWLVKNSYGPEDGNEGYFWISYYDKALLNDIGAVYEFNLVEPTDNNYQYDGSLGFGSFFSVNKIYGANVFTAKRTEILKEIAFIADNNTATYKYQIFLNPKKNDPTSGTPVYSEYKKANIKYAGYNTIELYCPVQLKKGMRFAVVIETANKGKQVTLATDFNGYADTTRTVKTKAVILKGQTFVSEDGKTWDDASSFKDGNNLRLKAITSAGKIAPKAISAKTITVERGKTVSSKAKPSPFYTSAAMTYSVSDSSIATVSASGAVTGKKVGECTLTITSKTDESVKKTVKIKVTPPTPAKFSKVRSTRTSVTLKWTKVYDADGYTVYIYKNGKVAKLKTTTGTTYKITGLKAATKYAVYVRSFAEIDGTTYRSPLKKLKVGTAK